ncbi:MAG: aldo/keto reductase [Firmicutes bacterium]|nr:aldo/keto reductase [Bacillota bacterium]MCL2256127.1 aldo/keto reductase [Bacillota bacterium]
MQYREDKHGNKLSTLGLGCMRFSGNNKETEKMILEAIEKGVNFFDTAFIYPNSEKRLGEILKKHDKRKDVFVATKLPHSKCVTKYDFDKYFSIQLERLQTNYIDYYFIHNITDFEQWTNLQKLGIEDWIREKKETGEIKQIGFSFHGTCDDFLKILDSYDWEFCMIQYNYYAENYQAGKTGLLKAFERGVPVMIMEPLLGGKLATGLPEQALKMFKKSNPELMPVDWAFWWLWNQKEVTVVLSGMNTLEQMQHNIKSATNFKPLTDEEKSVYVDVVRLFQKSYKIPCTNCNYCLPCPKGINIPSCLSSYNTGASQGFMSGMRQYITSTAVVSKNPLSPRKCNKCGKCEKQCPQNIEITKTLKKVARRYENPFFRFLLGIVRIVMVGKGRRAKKEN